MDSYYDGRSSVCLFCFPPCAHTHMRLIYVHVFLRYVAEIESISLCLLLLLLLLRHAAVPTVAVGDLIMTPMIVITLTT